MTSAPSFVTAVLLTQLLTVCICAHPAPFHYVHRVGNPPPSPSQLPPTVTIVHPTVSPTPTPRADPASNRRHLPSTSPLLLPLPDRSIPESPSPLPSAGAQVAEPTASHSPGLTDDQDGQHDEEPSVSPQTTDELAFEMSPPASPPQQSQITGPSFPTIPHIPSRQRTCFPASARVQLTDRSRIPMHALRVGHNVRVSSSHYSTVFMFSHRIAAPMHSFITLVTRHANLTLTPSHYVHVHLNRCPTTADTTTTSTPSSLTAQHPPPPPPPPSQRRRRRRQQQQRQQRRTQQHCHKHLQVQLLPAQEVQVGDALPFIGDDGTTQPATVLSVHTTRERGLYNPHTLHGDLVVNGFVTSAYTTAIPPSSAHALLSPARAAFAGMGLSAGVLEGDLGPWVEVGVRWVIGGFVAAQGILNACLN